MKALLSILALVFSVNVFATGKIVAKPGYYLKSDKVGGSIGLSIYEPLVGKLAYNQWTGYGYSPRPYDHVNFFVSTHDLEIPVGKITVGAGFTFKHSNKEDDAELFSDSDIHLKLAYKLW